jgi:hypothetical protein
MSTANRGKWAEGRVRDWLKAAEKADTAFHRFPDAHAGSLVTTPSDFLTCRQGRLTLLEVKEVQHSTRLPHKNFAPDQIARMRMWKMAGAHTWVLVCHMPVKVWRCVPLDTFMERTGGSWVLDEYELHSDLSFLENIL